MKLRYFVVLACIFPALTWISVPSATATSTPLPQDQTWSLQSVPAPTASVETQLDSESCTGPDWCVAVGLTVSATGQVPVVELWNGTIWSLGAFDTAGIALGALSGVSCTSSSSCQVVGFYRGVHSLRSTALAESWNGTSWSMEKLPSLRQDYLDGVSWENWAIESTLDPAGSPNVTLSSASCVADWCSAVGEYAPSASSSNYLPFAAAT